MADEQGICRATRADGSPCRAQARPGRSLCFAHDDELADKRQAAHALGGTNRSNAARARRALPLRAQELEDALVQVFHDVGAGRKEPRVGTAQATIAIALMRVRADGSLEDRMSELERKYGLVD